MDYLEHLAISADWQIIAQTSDKENVADLIDLYDDLNDCYGGYELLVQDFASAPPLSNFLAHKDLLVEYYENAPINLKKVISERRNKHSLRACPSCGNPYKPNTLDHFIPKHAWPEYSIYPNNLVPQCGGCAPIKGKRYFCDEEMSAIFIHPIYSDLLSRVRFGAVIDISDDTNSPRFTVRLWAGGLAGSDLTRVRQHLKKIDIQARMLNFLRSEFDHWKRIVSDKGINIQTAMAQRIRERVTDGERPKEWKAAFCQAVLDSPSAIRFFDSLASPKPRSVINLAECTEIIL